jgi:phosphoribosylaminoimidazole-succinocarboxamide synthase
LDRINKRNLPIDEKYENYASLFKYRNRYRRLAIKYQTFFIDTTNITPIEIVKIISRILVTLYGDLKMCNLNDYKLPNPDNITEEEFEKLPLVTKGESRIVRALNDQFNLIKYKPTIYSHKQQRAGVIEGSDIERMTMTRDLLYIFDASGISHCYWYVGKEYVLSEKLDPLVDIPPIEVIVKKCLVGTDKYIYYDLAKKKTRFGKPIVNENNEYYEPLVRFDYRNPNHHPETKLPLGDYAMGDDHADMFIDTRLAKQLAKKTFQTLDHHFKQMGVYFEDICLMITTDGSKLYSEISQDCGRYKKIESSKLDSLDKDVWRSGGSSDLVLLKWKEMTKITREYVKSIY